MKRKSIALLLALMMCLALLSACGEDNTAETSEPPSYENTAQPTQESNPVETEPVETEPAETGPAETEKPTETPGPENNAGTEFLALLREEWNNGFFEGEGPHHTYYDSHYGNRTIFIHNGVVYFADMDGYGDQWYCSYDIASKEFHKAPFSLGEWYENNSRYFMDNNFYFLCRASIEIETGVEEFPKELIRTQELRIYDYNGALLNSYPYAQYYIIFEKGILAMCSPNYTLPDVLLSHSLEKIAEIPVPQIEVEHGLKEDIKLDLRSKTFAADGTVYTRAYSPGNDTYYLYRLNMVTYEWENLGEWDVWDIRDFFVSQPSFCGKFALGDDGIYDRITGEQVFEYGDLYPAADSIEGLCYFGGDKYLGKKNNEYRWVNLTDMSMSDPLPFPEGKSVTVLNDTYCVYGDRYGLFLWNYNTGEEETIVTFDN